jgi:hypothetical protein
MDEEGSLICCKVDLGMAVVLGLMRIGWFCHLRGVLLKEEWD